jgi:ABC-type transport system involved in multi-copper enzyme maturation permease subunit
MHNIIVIAQGTVIRQLRNKVLYLLILLSFSFIGLGSLYKVLSLGAEVKLMQDLGLAGITVVGMVVAVFIGSNEVGKELREGTVDDLLAKPLGRDEFLLGKYAGTLLVALINISVITAGFAGILLYHTGAVRLDLFRAVLMSCFEVGVLAAVAIFFTTFLPEAAGAVITFLVFVAGHGAHMLPIISNQSGDTTLRIMAKALFYVIPNLHHFNLQAAVGQKVSVPWTYLVGAMFYALCYSGMLLSLGVIIFRKREL